MITLHGTTVNKGIAIAEAAVIGPGGDMSDLSTELLLRGIQALKRGTPDAEKPQVVVICDSLDDGLAVRLPGMWVAAVAAQALPNGETSSIPCIAGIDDLHRSVTNGDIIVVDGARGVVYVDPDIETLVHYQSTEEETQRTRRVFLGSAHLPATTQDGRTVMVFSTATRLEDVRVAFEEGADGTIVSESVVRQLRPDGWKGIIHDSGGKQVLLISSPNDDSLREIMTESLPFQFTIALPSPDQETLHGMEEHIGRISADMSSEGFEPAEIALGVVVDPLNGHLECAELQGVSRLILDATACEISATQFELAHCLSEVLGFSSADCPKVPIIVVLADSIDAVPHLLARNVDSIAVSGGVIAATKDLIRSFPSQE